MSLSSFTIIPGLGLVKKITLPEYVSWQAARSRCYNEKYHHYHRYGGRGIVMCCGWDDFATFFVDMGRRPKGTTLDRIDNDGNYSCGRCEQCLMNDWKKNCRWATKREQSLNKINASRVMINGETRSLTEWCERLDISEATVRGRIRKGMAAVEAVIKPIEHKYCSSHVQRNKQLVAPDPSGHLKTSPVAGGSKTVRRSASPERECAGSAPA